MQTEVIIRNDQSKTVDPARLERAARKSLQVEGFERPVEISILLLDDPQIQVMNKQYRGSDRPTDVLSFSQLEGEPFCDEGEIFPLGDIIVSVDTAESQAADVGHSLDDEMDLLVVHGVLHLLGHGDETPDEAADMRRRERAVLDRLRDGEEDQGD